MYDLGIYLILFRGQMLSTTAGSHQPWGDAEDKPPSLLPSTMALQAREKLLWGHT